MTLGGSTGPGPGTKEGSRPCTLGGHCQRRQNQDCVSTGISVRKSISVALNTDGALLSDLYKRHTVYSLSICSWLRFMKHLLHEGEASKKPEWSRPPHCEAEPHKDQSKVLQPDYQPTQSLNVPLMVTTVIHKEGPHPEVREGTT